MIDADLYNDEDPDGVQRLRALGTDLNGKKTSGSDDFHYDEYDYSDDEDVKTVEAKADSQNRSSLLEKEYCLCSPFVRGYCLSQKLWGTSVIIQ